MSEYVPVALDVSLGTQLQIRLRIAQSHLGPDPADSQTDYRKPYPFNNVFDSFNGHGAPFDRHV